ncbi:FkbM family methyltransferase [Candidatus Woesearchaeota archaeon]|nr:FkbM family methyltransferase [Candidatus Woesearchaeota archaeon]
MNKENKSIKTINEKREYEILSSIVNNNFPKYIVDIGSNDGINLSNSFPFVKEGWQALLVEANPFVFDKLKENLKNYQNVTTLNCTCSNNNGYGHLYLGNDGELGLLSSLCTDSNPWFEYARSDKKVQVKVKKLESILDDAKFPSDFGILLVDAEGMDFEVLEGLNFDRYRPGIIVTEEYRHNLTKHKKKYQLLKNKGYLLKHKIKCNTIWVNKKHSNSDSIFKHLNDMERILQKYLIPKSSSLIKFEDIKGLFNHKKYSVELIKKPKWEDDALIFKIEPLTTELTYKWSVKIHEDKYPLASHVCDNEELLNRIICSDNAAEIINTSCVKGKDMQFRITTYDYLKGKSLDSLLPDASDETILKLRNGLKKCVESLLKSGVNVFVRDLSDFIVVPKGDEYKVILTDFNAIMDCSNANKYSREKVMEIIGCIINKLVTGEYKPFISQRPTMIDLESKNDFRI